VNIKNVDVVYFFADFLSSEYNYKFADRIILTFEINQSLKSSDNAIKRNYRWSIFLRMPFPNAYILGKRSKSIPHVTNWI